MHITTPGARKYVRNQSVDALAYEDTPAGRARMLAFVNARSGYGHEALLKYGRLVVLDEDGDYRALEEGDVVLLDMEAIEIWDAVAFGMAFDESEDNIPDDAFDGVERWQYDGKGTDLGLLNRLNEFYGRTHAAYVSAAGLVIESSPARIICVVPKDHYLYFTPNFPEARSE